MVTCAKMYRISILKKKYHLLFFLVYVKVAFNREIYKYKTIDIRKDSLKFKLIFTLRPKFSIGAIAC